MNFVFRVDSSEKIGSGHVMRCLTLADKLKYTGINCTFLCERITQSAREAVMISGHSLKIFPEEYSSENISTTSGLDNPLKWLSSNAVDWLVVDHYKIGAEWERAVSKLIPDVRILAIDDLADRAHHCDLLLDVMPARTRADYKVLVDENTKCLLGLEYALLRAEFSALRDKQGEPRNMPLRRVKILVTLGGGDNEAALVEVLEAVCELRNKHDLDLTVIGKQLSGRLLESLPHDLIWIEQTSQMSRYMADCDLIICAAGGTSWERCCLGLPAVVLTIAENQSPNARAIENAGAGTCVPTERSEIARGISEILEDPSGYAIMSENAWKLCDGKGADRVVKEILGQSMSLVDATLEDAEFVFDTRYSGQAYRFYKNPVMPDYETHMPWFEAALVSDRYRLYCVELGREKIAHVRFDLEPGIEDRAEIGIAMAPDFRGKGLSVSALGSAINHASMTGISKLDAEVHRENIASRKLFEKAGFELTRDDKDAFLGYQWIKK
ncbi:MAG: UDP-2,4-diacetamido-2,4,6-trideoxy-beta-L-altropyranose hydrolase [Pseudomonadota bacterium]